MPELPTQQNLDLTNEVTEPDMGGNSEASKFIPKKNLSRFKRQEKTSGSRNTLGGIDRRNASIDTGLLDRDSA